MKRVFLSFKMDDKKQVDGVRLLAWHDHVDLEFFDESVRVPYDSENAAYIRSRIKEKIVRASVTLCLLGPRTHESKWVDWELKTSKDLGNRIIIMGLPRHPDRMAIPASVMGYPWYIWDVNHLQRLIASV
jgi:hypothetical protein